jgi:hypothetical protein
MKILRIVFLSLVAVGVAGFAVFRNVEARRDRRVFAVGLVCQGDLSNGQKEILEAYSSVLQEEGVPYRVLTMTPLLLENPEKIISWRPVLIFPDQLALQANDDMGFWLERYVRAGGTALVVFDAGTKDKESGAFRERAVFQETVGLHYSLYNEMGEKTYARGYLRFQSKEEADFFQIPQGKIFEGNLLGGYAYGSLEYTMARTRPVTGAAPRVFAELVTKENERCPALTLAKLGKGNAFYAGLPLGQLKGFSDDLPLRAVLRTVLFQVAGVPHLLSVPEGKGGLVINWHIDSNAEWASLPWMVKQGYFRQSIPCSLHVTAGDFRDAPGDRLGFDAAGVGRPALEKVRRFGVLGSHGGWGHNWFSDNLNRGMLDAPAIEENVLRNNRALEGISGVPVRE